MKKRTRRAAYRPSFQTLERRELLAGDFRTIDGVGNHQSPGRTDFGAADTQLLRFGYRAEYPAPGRFGDTIVTAPNARDVSNAINAQTESIPNSRDLSDWIVQWGQFLTHDLDLTTNGAANNVLSTGQTGDFSIPINDPNDVLGPNPIPFNRSDYDPTTGNAQQVPGPGGPPGPGQPPGPNLRPNWREQINGITAFIDASQVYGSDAARAAALRTFAGGKLATTADGALPDFNTSGEENDNALGLPEQSLLLAGDIRANEQVGLTSAHALFVREHNRLADIIAAQNPGISDEEIYQWARKIVGAEMQIITYTEFLPALMGNSAPNPNAFQFSEQVEPGITTSFSTAFFRFGHSMQSPQLLLVDNNGVTTDSLSLRHAFFNTSFLVNEPGNVDLILKGLASQIAQELDTLLIDDIRNFLFGPPGAGGLDLAALDIQRARDHGLLDYNEFRVAYGLQPFNSFNQITSDPALRTALQATYGDINSIDAFIGALAEDHLPGKSIGELLNFSINNQFTRLRDGDRYFYTGDADLQDPIVTGAIDLSGLRLSDVIKANTGITNIQDNVFVVDTSVPTVTLGIVSEQIAEGGATQVTATLSFVHTAPVTVNLGFSGTANGTSDYHVTAQTIQIPAGQLVGSMTLTAAEDDIDEPNESVIIDVTSVIGATEAGSQHVSAVIIDTNPRPELSVSIDNDSILESGGTAVVTVEMSGPSSRPISGTLSFGGTATGSGVDYAVTSSQFVIPPGQTSTSVTITASSDDVDETNETITVAAVDVAGANVAPGTASTSIIDDDDPPTVQIAIDNQQIAESGGVATVTASLSAISSFDVVVQLGLSGTADGGGVDYSIAASEIVISAGDLHAATTITAVADADSSEGNETVVVEITGVTGGTELGQSQAETVILDATGSPTVALSISSAVIAEAGGSSIVTATLSGAATETVVVTLATAGTASAGDFSVDSLQITIPTNSLSGFVTITAEQDELDEVDETVTVDIASVTGALEAGVAQVMATIVDDDDPPTVSISSDVAEIAENGGAATITATLSAVSSRDVTLQLSLDGTAQSGENDFSITSTSITIAAGQTTATTTISGLDDDLDEDHETVLLAIESAANATIDPDQVTVTILDDDDPRSVSLSVNHSSIAENDGSASVTATLTEIADSDVIVELQFAGTAIRGDDFQAAAEMTIPAGQTEVSIPVTAINDNVYESTELIVVRIDNVIGAEIGVDRSVAIEIADDETLPTVSLLALDEGISELGGARFVTAALSGPSSVDIAVDLAFAGTADLDVDYATTHTSLVITAGSETATATLIAIDDDEREATETIQVDIDSVVGATEQGQQQVTVEIIDDDVPHLVVVETAGDTSVTERGSEDTILVALSTIPVDPVQLLITFDHDSEAIVSTTTLTFTSENASQPQAITVTGLPDLIDDGDQSTTVTIAVVVPQSDSDYADVAPVAVEVTTVDTPVDHFRIREQAGSLIVEAADDDRALAHYDAGSNDPIVLTTGSHGERFTIGPLGNVAADVSIVSAGGDDIIDITGWDFASINGGDGFDRLRLRSASTEIDLSTFAVGSIMNIESIHIGGLGPNRLHAHHDDLVRLQGATGRWTIEHDRDDSVDYGIGWTVDAPQFVDGRQMHVLRQGEFELNVMNESDWQNPLQPTDVDRSGRTLASDALRIINELGVRGVADLPIVDTIAKLPAAYLDVTGEGFLSGLDALRIINRLGEVQIQSTAESETVLRTLLPSSRDTDPVDVIEVVDTLTFDAEAKIRSWSQYELAIDRVFAVEGQRESESGAETSTEVNDQLELMT